MPELSFLQHVNHAHTIIDGISVSLCYFILVPSLGIKVHTTRAYQGGLIGFVSVPIVHHIANWRLDIVFPRQVFDLKVCFVQESSR